MSVTGMDELLLRLQSLGDGAKRVENRALRAGGQRLAEEMKRHVNVSSRNEVHVRDDIQVSDVKTKGGVKLVEVGVGKATAWRAKFLEFGTSKMTPRPFVQPAVDTAKDEVLTAIRETIREALKL